MRIVLNVVSFVLTGCIGASAGAQINYVDQLRAVQANSQSTATGTCGQSQGAPDFDVFNESVACPGANASQNSTLGPTLISCTAAANTSFVFSSSNSRLTAHFTLREAMHYELRGQLFAISLPPTVRLTGPRGDIHVHTEVGVVNFSHCGTLEPGTYEIHSRADGGGGGDGTLNFTLRITRPGDINGDQTVNVDDLLAVVNGWGACPASQSCPADLDCSGDINVDDLLGVINNWG